MKRQIFYGNPQTGKTKRAIEIAEKYNEDEVVWIDEKIRISPYFLRDCTDKTKLIIIDDCIKNFNYDYFMAEKFLINKQHQYPIEITPELIIFTTIHKPENKNESFLRRFELIEFK